MVAASGRLASTTGRQEARTIVTFLGDQIICCYGAMRISTEIDYNCLSPLFKNTTKKLLQDSVNWLFNKFTD